MLYLILNYLIYFEFSKKAKLMKIINKILIIKFQKDQDFQNQLKMMTILLIR